jgi:hypothetical protein
MNLEKNRLPSEVVVGKPKTAAYFIEEVSREKK